MQLRHELANAVIQAIGAKSYLQLGSARAIAEIDCPGKQSYYLESADQIPPGKVYDVVFVDPPHDPGRALFALNVGLERLSPAGVLLVANVNPAEEWMQEVPASAGVALGQAWRAWVEFRWSVGFATGTVDLDHGVGVVLRGFPAPTDQNFAAMSKVGFEQFAAHRKDLLSLDSAESVLGTLKSLQAPEPTSAASGTAPAPTEVEPETATAAPTTDQPESEPAAPARRRRRDRTPT